MAGVTGQECSIAYMVKRASGEMVPDIKKPRQMLRLRGQQGAELLGILAASWAATQLQSLNAVIRHWFRSEAGNSAVSAPQLDVMTVNELHGSNSRSMIVGGFDFTDADEMSVVGVNQVGPIIDHDQSRND